jgi:hypothetical protein
MNKVVMSHVRDIYVSFTRTTIKYKIPRHFYADEEKLLNKPIIKITDTDISITFQRQEPTSHHWEGISYDNPLIETEKTAGNGNSSQLRLPSLS